MLLKYSRFIYSIVFLLFFSSSAIHAASIPAFPGAEGFGANTPGGRGGDVYEVTNLNDSGSGSLRACVDASGPRTCVFRIGGTIELSEKLDIENPFITIAGQTAPGDGIAITVSPQEEDAPIQIESHDVIIRGLRVRAGPSEDESPQRRGITIEKSVENVIIDHSSISWATDDNVTMIDGVRNLTIQNSIISEALSDSTHSEGEHSKGMAISGKMYNSDWETGNISVHHNLFAHNRDRNPRMAMWGLVDVVNNVMYNYGYDAVEANDGLTKISTNVVKNFMKPGADTGSSSYEVVVDHDEGRGAFLYVEGNIGPHRTSDSEPDINSVNPDHHEWVISSRHPAPPITTLSAEEAYEYVLDNAGALHPHRDSVDSRVVASVRNGTGRIIDDPSDVGGWPNLSSGTPPTDTDHDGMPDSYETANGLNPNDPADRNHDQNGDGYTNLEGYLNSFYDDQGSSITPTPSDGLPGDIDGDGDVDISDLSMLLSSFGSMGSGNSADINEDGVVSIADLSTLLSNFGKRL